MATRRAGRRRRKGSAMEPVLGNLAGLLPVDEQAALAEALATRPPKAVRLRPPTAGGAAQPGMLPFPTEPVPWYPAGCFCLETHQPGRYLAHAAGEYFVQDAGSMLALRLLDLQPAEWVADVCAAPGAKASAILEQVGPGGGFLLANEPIHSRVPALAYNLARVGFPRYMVSVADPEQLLVRWDERFHAVLVDAPCTGQTLLGRGRQSAAAFTDTKITHAAARQQRILAAAARLVMPGGRLVYSTCTFAVEENEAVIETFLQQEDDWQVEPLSELAAWQSPRAPGGYRLYPHRDRCSGAYAIRLRRRGELPAAAGPVNTDGSFEPLIVGDELIGATRHGQVVRRDQRQEGWPTDLARQVPADAGQGCELAYRPGKHWMPAHGLALRRDTDWRPQATLDLDAAAAQQFLQGLTLPAGPCGWTVATWRGHPLGWLRGNRERCNNGLPAAARLGFAAAVE